MSERKSQQRRETKETQLEATLNLDGTGDYSGSLGLPFFEHMLDLLARHGLLDLTVSGKGDLEVDAHHTVEDMGIVLGRALAEALGEKQGIRRIATAFVPMEETLVRCVLDICGRPYLGYRVAVGKERVGGFETELAEDFFRALAMSAGITMHLDLLQGGNAHHVIEASFKAFARALREAASIDPREQGVPSTKGAL